MTFKIITAGIENDLNKEQVERAYHAVSFSPEKRADRDIAGYVEDLLQLAEHIEKHATDPRQQAIAQNTFEDLRTKYKARTLKWLSAKSRCMSSMITGPANFPVRRAEKANRAEHGRLQELIEFSKAMNGYALKTLNSAIPKTEQQADALEVARVLLAHAEKWQEHMKTANAMHRKGDMTALRQYFAGFYFVAADGISAFNKLLRNVDKCGVGFERFELTNNLAKIKRMRERVAELEKKQELIDAPIAPAEKHEGLEIVRNTAEDRLQLIFAGKPDETIRTILKRHGFKWSPRFGAWQRQLTANAENALKWILPQLTAGA